MNAIRRSEFMFSFRELIDSLRASPVFALAVLITLAQAGLNALMVLLMSLAPELLPAPLSQMQHFTLLEHRIHDLTFGFLFVPAALGLLAQLGRPARNVAGMAMALIPWAGLLLAALLSEAFAPVILFNPSRVVAALTLIAALLHPAGRHFFRSFRVSRVDWTSLALVAVAAVPLLAFASINIGLQRTLPGPHAAMGHYGFMAAFAFTVIGVGLVASLRPAGWRLSAWVAGLLPVLLGVASLLYPLVDSSLGLGWALAAIAWGVGFVARSELAAKAVTAAPAGSPQGSEGGPDDSTRPSAASAPSAKTPLWVNVSGLIAIALVLLFFRGFAGGPDHAPGAADGPGAADQPGLHRRPDH
jgi:hypothetical protein